MRVLLETPVLVPTLLLLIAAVLDIFSGKFPNWVFIASLIAGSFLSSVSLRLRLSRDLPGGQFGIISSRASSHLPRPLGGRGDIKMNARLSAAGIPQIAGVFGDCIMRRRLHHRSSVTWFT